MGDIVFTSSGYAPTHQTSGIIKSDWRKLFTPDESKPFRYLVKNIDGDLSELPNAAALTEECGLPGVETWTWLDVLQVSVEEWADASWEPGKELYERLKEASASW